MKQKAARTIVAPIHTPRLGISTGSSAIKTGIPKGISTPGPFTCNKVEWVVVTVPSEELVCPLYAGTTKNRPEKPRASNND